MPDRRRLLPSALAALLVAVGAFLAASLLAAVGLIETTELQGYDYLLSACKTLSWPQDLVVIDFDDRTMDSIGRSLIPRATLAEVIDKAASGGPVVIGLDILLDERRDARDDHKLSVAIEHAGNVILAENFGGRQLPPSGPLAEFREHALDTAFVNLPIDPDGSIRRMFLWMRGPDYSGISFPVALASNYIGQPLREGPKAEYRLGSIRIFGDDDLPNAALIGHWTALPAPSVAVWRLLQPSFDTRLLQGKVVLIGQSSARGKDLYPSPVFHFRNRTGGGVLLSGLQIHAAAVVTLLQGETICVLSRGRLWGLNFLLILLAATLVVRLKPLASGLLLAGSLLGVLLLAAFFLARFGIWMKFISTEAGLLGAFVGGTGYRLAEERWLKRRVETERNRFEQELSLARTIQEGLLPESLPQVEGLEFGVRYETSLLVGGDYYDFFQPNATTLLFVVADVEGKGAASALIMSNVQATLHALLRSAAPSPEWIVATLNACVIESAHSRKLITLFLGWIDLPSRELRYVNAGHLPPLLARTTGDMLSLSEGGMLLGFSPPGTYTSGSVELLPSDVLAVFTDGITEAANTHAEEFGTERLAMAINRSRVKSAGKIADDVFAEVRSFSAGGTHEDDKVVMVIKVC